MTATATATATAVPVAVDLPDGFVVVDATDPRLVELPEPPDPSPSPWLDGVQQARERSRALLVAVAPLAGGVVSLAVGAAQLPPGPPPVLLAGLREVASARTSSAGEVAVLDLPAGPAVAAADVVSCAGSAHALVEVWLPLPSTGQLWTLVLTADHADQLPVCASLAAAVAGRIRPVPQEEP